MQAIDLEEHSVHNLPVRYHWLKQGILNLRDSNLVLTCLAELEWRMEMTLHAEDFELAELDALVGLLAGICIAMTSSARRV